MLKSNLLIEPADVEISHDGVVRFIKKLIVQFCGISLLATVLSAQANPVVELDPLSVVTTATRTARLATELPIRTEMLTPELFRSAGTQDLASALNYLPGARVEANCQNCGTAEVRLLGLGAGYNQLLFDGQPLFSGLASVYGLEHIPTAFIERIEVVKGGASALYGPGAVAGVINIIPHEPAITQGNISTNYEEFAGEPSYSATGVWDWVSADNKWATTLYAKHHRNDAVDLNNDAFSEVPEKQFSSIGTNFWAYPADKMRVSGNYAYTTEERRGGNRFDLLPHEAQITEQLEHHWHRGGLFLEQNIGSDFKYKVGGSISYIDRDSYYGGVGGEPLPGEPGFDSGAYNAALADSRLLYGYSETMRYYLDSLFTRHFDRHALSWGIQYQRDEIFDQKLNDLGQPLRTDGSIASYDGEDPIADDSFDNFGVFIQDEWDPASSWTVIGGMRADHHSELHSWVFSPRAAARYTANEQWLFRTSVATGFRAPEIFDEDFHIEILDDPTRTRNAPDLKEEKSISFATGFVWTPAFAQKRMQVDVEFYRTEIRDTFSIADIVYTDPAGNAYKLRENAGKSTVQGFEANLLYQFTEQFSFEGGIRYADASYHEPVEILPDVFESRYTESPRWSGVAQLNYKSIEYKWDAFLGLVYTGPMIVTEEQANLLKRDTGHFFVVDFTLTRHIELPGSSTNRHLDLTFGVRNLFDQRQKDLSSGPERDATYFYGPRFPRSYFISLELEF